MDQGVAYLQSRSFHVQAPFAIVPLADILATTSTEPGTGC